MKDKILEWMKEDIKNGKILTAQEFCQEHGTSRPTLYKHYKSINELRKLAGGSSKRKDPGKQLTDDELLERIRDFYRRNKRAPKHYELGSKNTITIRFGSWNKAIEIALGEKRVFSKEEIKELYLELCDEMKKVMSSHEFYSITRITETIIVNNFGSWNNFREELGYERIEKLTVTSNEDLKRLYIEVSFKIGRENGAYGREFTELTGFSEGTLNRFGGINSLRKECGFKVREKRSKYSRKSIETQLIKAWKKIKRRPKSYEIEADKSLPSVSTCTRYFKTTKMSEVWEEIEKIVMK